MGNAFPATETAVLAQAAAGVWEPFFQNYLRPCWQAVCRECGRWGLQQATADDIFGELAVRLMRDGRFRTELGAAIAQCPQSDCHGNIPARYLASRQPPLRQTRFRAYLCKVINNLAMEEIRARRRRPKQGDEALLEQYARQLHVSVSRSLDRQWLLECLSATAWQLAAESRSARTRARRRLFHVLYCSAVQNQSAGKIAVDLGLERSTVAGLLSEARGRFLEVFAETTGISEIGELRHLLHDEAEQLRSALAQVYGDEAAASGT